MTRATPGDFERLCADIECEAHDEGPQAFQELEHLRAECRLAGEAIALRLRLGNNLGNKLSETQQHAAAETPANTGSIN
jgi:hypothetical protein